MKRKNPAVFILFCSSSFAKNTLILSTSNYLIRVALSDVNIKDPRQHAPYVVKAWADPEGGGDRGSRSPLKNHKHLGFLSNTGLDPLKITKLPSQNSMLGHHLHASERHLNGVLLAGRGWPTFNGIWIISPLIK